jgi:hypothetical protein
MNKMLFKLLIVGASFVSIQNASAMDEFDVPYESRLQKSQKSKQNPRSNAMNIEKRNPRSNAMNVEELQTIISHEPNVAFHQPNVENQENVTRPRKLSSNWMELENIQPLQDVTNIQFINLQVVSQANRIKQLEQENQLLRTSVTSFSALCANKIF